MSLACRQPPEAMARSATAPDKKAGAMKEKAPPAAASGKGAAELKKRARASPLENPLLHVGIIHERVYAPTCQ